MKNILSTILPTIILNNRIYNITYIGKLNIEKFTLVYSKSYTRYIIYYQCYIFKQFLLMF